MRKFVDKDIYEYYRKYFIGHKKSIFILIVCILLGVFLTSAVPFIYGQIIDGINNKDIIVIKKYILFNVFIIFFTTIISSLESYMGNIINLRISNKIKLEIYNCVLNSKQKYISRFNVGELLSHIDMDAGNVISFILNLMTNIIFLISNIAIALYFVIRISGILSSFILIFIVGMSIIYFAFKSKMYYISKKKREFMDSYLSFLNQSLSNLLGIKIFRLSKTMENLFL